MKKRVLSALLALCLTLSLAGTALAADDLQSATPSGSAAVQITDDEGGDANPQTSVKETEEPENADANPTALSDAETEPETKPEDGEELDTEPVEDTDESTDSIESSDASGTSTPVDNGTPADDSTPVEEATPAPQPLQVARNNASTLADDGSDLGELLIGKSIDVTGEKGYDAMWPYQDSPHEWTQTSPDGGEVAILGNSNKVTVRGKSAGTVIITHKYWDKGKWEGIRDGYTYPDDWAKTQTFIITVTDKVRVYVYVASKVTDTDGNLVQPELSWADNPDFLRLLGLSEDTVDNNKYFPVGEIEVDYKVFENQQSPYLKDDSDWEAVKEALAQLDTSTLQGVFAQNAGNKVSDYTDQIITDMGASSGSQKSALFDWSGHSNGFSDDSVKYHLDLRFNTNTITFITGNNGITSDESEEAADGTVVEQRVYISGSQIQEPTEMPIPEGYKFDGYFEDNDFSEPWDGIGSSLNEDLTIYIRISPMTDVTINYFNVSGDGTGSVNPDYEHFNPVTGAPKGSTAQPVPGYRFAGWYSNQDCTDKVSDNAVFIPTKPEGGWKEGQELNYYAKFIPDIADVTITKTFEGLPEELIAEAAQGITFTVKKDGEAFRQGITLSDSDSDGKYTATIEDLTIGETYTIEEEVTAPQNYKYNGNTIKFNNTATFDGSFIVGTEGNALVVTNEYERQTGSLVLDKNIDGWNITTDQRTAVDNLEFEFTVEGPADAAGVVVVDNPEGEEDIKFVSDQNGSKVVVPVKVGKNVTISNLPTGTYTVTETDPKTAMPEILDGAYYFKKSTCHEDGVKVTVSDGKIGTATITNTYKPYKTLTITKSVTGGMGSLEQWFNFTLTGPNTIKYTLSDDQKPTTQDSSFRLKDGSTVTLTKIKEGDTITITEEPLTELGYTFKSTTVSSDALQEADTSEEDWSGYTKSTNGIEIRVPVGDDTDLGEVKFTNERMEVAPTGLEDNHTKPFGLMVGVAVMAGLALAGGAVVRRRRRWME